MAGVHATAVWLHSVKGAFHVPGKGAGALGYREAIVSRSLVQLAAAAAVVFGPGLCALAGL